MWNLSKSSGHLNIFYKAKIVCFVTSSGANVFTAVIYECLQQATSVRHWQALSLTFVGKAMSLPRVEKLKGASLRLASALLKNIRQAGTNIR